MNVVFWETLDLFVIRLILPITSFLWMRVERLNNGKTDLLMLISREVFDCALGHLAFLLVNLKLGPRVVGGDSVYSLTSRLVAADLGKWRPRYSSYGELELKTTYLPCPELRGDPLNKQLHLLD
jgi:hypothetical protein